MKYIIASFLVLVSLNINAQFSYYPFPPTKTDYAKNAAAQIKVCKEYMVSFNEKILNKVLEYGSEGLPVVLYEKGINDNSDSTTIEEIDYKYTNGKLILENVTNYVSQESYKVSYTYSKTGQLLKKKIIEIDPTTYSYVYDKLGRAVKATISVRMPDENGKAFDFNRGRSDFMYNTKGKVIEQIDYSKDNEKQFVFKWQYNNKGQVIKITRYQHGELVSEEVLEYQSNGLLLKRIENKPKEEPTVFLYEYCTNCKQSWMK